MTQLQGFGALLFGAVALAFVGALAILFGDPASITAAFAAMGAAYASQFCTYLAAYFEEHDGMRVDALYVAGLLLQAACVVLTLLSFTASVWF